MAEIKTFFDTESSTATHLIWCTATKKAAVIDSVLGFDLTTGKTNSSLLEEIAKFISEKQLTVDYILETHAHADHISGAPYLKYLLGGKPKIGIGCYITKVQEVFVDIFHLEGCKKDGTQFDILFKEGDTFNIGNLQVHILETPGHTPACISYYIPESKVIFVGDTIFMPDGGTARCDFPQGSAKTLWHSIHKILSLPYDTRIMICHDYGPGGRPIKWETSVKEQKEGNIHVKDGTAEPDFIKMRTERDATLAPPKLIIPSIQVNINNGKFPNVEPDGKVYIKVPVNLFAKPIGNIDVNCV